MRQISILLLTASLATTAAAYPTHGNLLYSADISTGEARYFGKISVAGDLSKTALSDFGYAWLIDAWRFLIINFTLPEVAIENCHLEVREKGMLLDYPILITNDKKIQVLKEAIKSNQYDLDKQLLHPGNNELKITGFHHNLAIQTVVIQCQYPLPTLKPEKGQSITLLSPVINQHIVQAQPITIEWGSTGLPAHSLLDLDYLDKAGQWQTITKGVAYNHPTGVGNRGLYVWEALPDDVNPQWQVRINYDPKQPKKGDIWKDKLTGMKLIYIPSGCFQIGSPETEVGHDPVEPQTRFCVEGFWMGQTEVTNAQYRFMANHESGENLNGKNQPVVNVNRIQAEEFANWLSKQTGETFRLPTDAEWEYAARAGKTTAYEWHQPTEACEYANIADVTWRNAKRNTESQSCQDGYVLTAPVAQFRKNAFGLYDMMGNAAEWVCSELDRDMEFFYNYAKANTCEKGSVPLFRGGSFEQWGRYIRFAMRYFPSEKAEADNLGFRLVREVSDRD